MIAKRISPARESPDLYDANLNANIDDGSRSSSFTIDLVRILSLAL